MKRGIVALFLMALASASNAKTDTCVADMVNPLVGTLSTIDFSAGNTYPAIALPWGMNFWTPQTGRMGDGWTYVYTDNLLRGFKQTHQPSPWMNDYGQFAVMPETGQGEIHQDRRASHFSHKAEEVHPYYYKVYLADYDIVTEMVPTERALMLRITYPETNEASFVVDAMDGGSYVKVVEKENMIVGYTTKNSGGVAEGFKNYFVLMFDHPFASVRTVSVNATEDPKDDYGEIVASEDLEKTANHVGAIVEFGEMARSERVEVRVASSFISMEQAEQNLKELGEGDFDKLKERAKARWNDVLGVVEVKDDDVDHKRTFYSCLYRSVLFPRTFYEVSAKGATLHYSPYNGQICSGYMFVDTGFWDTFRSLFPLLNLLYPSMNVKMQEGLVNAYRESGFLPEWSSPGHRECMVGNNSASVVADAYVKGQRVDDAETLWQAVVKGTHEVHPQVSSTGRRGASYYDRLGYVPCDGVDEYGGMNESVARTLEYAYDDWCIYQFGKALGKSEKELEGYERGALNYRNVYDKETKLMRGRKEDGTFQTPFSPLKWGDAYTEGNAWHYTWSVFHDPQGLIDLMDGKGAFNAMLDSVFSLPPEYDESYYGRVIHEIREMQTMNMGNYAHGNQPIQHAIYLYDWSGEPWKTQYWVRQVMDRLYSDTPDGYCGDEDNGQTSAWYVFSAMGFYPVCPGGDEYAIGTPYFDEMKIRLETGNCVDIVAKGNTAENCYVRELRIDGKEWDKNYFTHEQLLRGGRYVYEMDHRPNETRGVDEESAPYSFSREE